MTKRERNLAVVVGGIVGLLLLYVMVNRIFVAPAQETQQLINVRTDELLKEQEKSLQYLRDQRVLAQMKDQLYGADPDVVAERARARLDRMLRQCGLPVNMTPIRPSVLQRTGGDLEIGWKITARGRLESIFDFLYLLQEDAYVNRLENVRVGWVKRSNDFDLTVHYLTLVLRGVKPADAFEEQPLAQLDTEAHRRYWSFVQRDLFREFIEKPQPRVVQRPPDPPPPQRNTPPPPPPPPPPTPVHTVVGLPRTTKGFEVWVKSSHEPSARMYKVGDSLAGGQIVCVDHRPMPDPRNPKVNSPSRVIIRIGDAYWAVEAKQALTEKRRLRPEDLPEELRKPAEPASADTATPDPSKG